MSDEEDELFDFGRNLGADIVCYYINGDPPSIAKIREILPRLDEAGRISAISAFGRLNVKEATEAVLENVNDPSPQVRKTAVAALAKIKTPEAKGKLKEIAERDPEQWIRSKASKYLTER